MARRWPCCSAANGSVRSAAGAALRVRGSRRPALALLRRERQLLARALAQELDLHATADLLPGEQADEIVGAGHRLTVERELPGSTARRRSPRRRPRA